MQYCKCHNVLTIKEAVNGLKEEVAEFIQEPSLDEGSDVIYCINRLLGSMVGLPIIKLVPGNKLHMQKIENRMKEYGCIRSRRHLIDGKCPSIR